MRGSGQPIRKCSSQLLETLEATSDLLEPPVRISSSYIGSARATCSDPFKVQRISLNPPQISTSYIGSAQMTWSDQVKLHRISSSHMLGRNQATSALLEPPSRINSIYIGSPRATCWDELKVYRSPLATCSDQIKL